MFAHRQNLRRWAARVLLMWMFSVVAGLANACLAPASGPADVHGDHIHGWSMESPADAPAAAKSDQGEAQHSFMHQHDAGDEQPSTSSTTNCQDFCEKTSVSIPSVKTALDDIQGHGLPLPAVVFDIPQPAIVPTPLWTPCRDGSWAPPIPIAFLRLAL